TDLTKAAISTITRVGKDPGNIVRPLGPIEPIQTGDGSGTGTPFAADERQPEFPGGEYALRTSNGARTFYRTARWSGRWLDH
ncbi:MAG: hypothetical protein RIQ34_1039, partial [Bacteroidota bacterium]